VITKLPRINPTAKMLTAIEDRLNHRLTTGEFADIVWEWFTNWLTLCFWKGSMVMCRQQPPDGLEGHEKVSKGHFWTRKVPN
jgi:hypothetical protein